MAKSGTLSYYPSVFATNKNLGIELDWSTSYAYTNPTGSVTVTTKLYLVYKNSINTSSVWFSTSMTDETATLDSTGSIVDDGGTSGKRRLLETRSHRYDLGNTGTTFPSKTISLAAHTGPITYMGQTYSMTIPATDVTVDGFSAATRNITVSITNTTKNSISFTTTSTSGEYLNDWYYQLNGGSKVNLASVSWTMVTGTISNLTPGTTYSLVVGATVTEYPNVPALSSSTSVTTVSETPPTITVTVDDVQGYSAVITASSDMPCTSWQYTLNGATYSFTNASASVTAISQTLTGLSPNTQYTVTVTAMTVATMVTGTSSPLIFRSNGPTSLTATAYSIELAGNPTIPIEVNVKNDTNRHDIFLRYTSSGSTLTRTIATRKTLVTGVNDITLTSEDTAWIVAALGSDSSKIFTLGVTSYTSMDAYLGSAEDGRVTFYTTDSIAPIFTNFTYQDVGPDALTLTGNNQYFVKGKSAVSINASGARPGVSGVTLTGYTASYNQDSGVSDTSTIYISQITAEAGTYNLSVTVTDSRGLSKTVSKQVTTLDYSNVQISEFNISKLQNGNVHLDFRGSFTSVKIGNTEKNALQSLYFQVRRTDELTWSEEIAITPTFTGTTFSYTTDNLLSGTSITIDPDYSYYIRVTAQDKVTEDSYQGVLASDTPLMSYRKGMVGINNKHPNAALDVIGEIEMNGFNVQGFVRTLTNEDLNDVLEAGIFLADTPTSVDTQHYPDSVRGVLESLPELQGFTQRFTKIPTDGTMWLRSCSISGDTATFTDWSQIAGEGTFTQVQSDWNVTDSNSKAFIRNKETVMNALDNKAPLEHTHNVQEVIAGSDDSAAATNGDALIFSDASDGGKLKKMSLGFTTATTYLRRDGTWATPTNSNTVPAAQCNTVADNAAKSASCTYYVLKANSYTHFNFRYSNTAKNALTMTVNSTGPKPIYINGEASSASNHTLPAGTYIAYYDGTAYQFRTDGRLPGKIMAASDADHATSADLATTALHADVADEVPWTGIQNRPALSHVTAELVSGTTYKIKITTV